MAKAFAFIVDGKPQPKQRARATRKKAGGLSFRTPNETKVYERKVMLNARRAMPAGWPTDAHYRVSCVFYWPDRHGRDVDNALKAIKDGLNKCAWNDDRQAKLAHACAPVDPVSKERSRALVIIEQVSKNEILEEICGLEEQAARLGARCFLK